MTGCAEELADAISPDHLHRTLDRYAAQCCPVSEAFGQSYHWSLMQVEYATDLAFRSTTTLGPLYEQLTRETVLSVKAEQIVTFLGRQITPLLAQEIGSQFATRIEGGVKHRFGKCSIKMYDKCGIVLRIETTTNDARRCSGAGRSAGRSPRWSSPGVIAKDFPRSAVTPDACSFAVSANALGGVLARTMRLSCV